MKLSAVIFATFLSLTTNAREGGNGSHGGSVVTCTDEQGHTTTELAEFREIKTRNSTLGNYVEINYRNDPVEQQMNEAIDRLVSFDPEVAETVRRYAFQIKRSALAISNYSWGSSGDVNFFPYDVNCQAPVTAVNYWADDMIEYQKSLVDVALKNRLTDLAGLWVHEGVFRLQRERSNIMQTLPTRRIVSLLFAKQDRQDLLSGMVAKYLKLRGPETRIYEISTPATQLSFGLTEASQLSTWHCFYLETHGKACDRKLNALYTEHQRRFINVKVGDLVEIKGQVPNNVNLPATAEIAVSITDEAGVQTLISEVKSRVNLNEENDSSRVFTALKLWIISSEVHSFEIGKTPSL